MPAASSSTCSASRTTPDAGSLKMVSVTILRLCSLLRKWCLFLFSVFVFSDVMRKSGKRGESFFRPGIGPWGLVTAAGFLSTAGTLLGFLGTWSWLCDLFSHFRAQYFIALALSGALLLIPRWRKTAAAFGLLALVNLAVILPLYLPPAPKPAPGVPSVRLFLLNVNVGTGRTGDIAALLRRYDPDIVALLEVGDRVFAGLKDALAPYPSRLVFPREDSFGMGFFSRRPLKQASKIVIGEAGLPSILALVEMPRGECTVLVTHPLPPAGAEWSRLRNEQFARLAETARGIPGPLLLVGDLNAAPWNQHFRRLLRDSGLQDSARGRGVQPTWPAGSILLRIPLDHCLHSPSVRILDRQIGPDVGSDHLPVIMDFTLEEHPGD